MPMMVIVSLYIDGASFSGHPSCKEVSATLCTSLLYLGDSVQNLVSLQWSIIGHVIVVVPSDIFPRKGEDNIAMTLRTPTLPGYYFSNFIAPTVVYNNVGTEVENPLGDKQFPFYCL